LGLITAKIKYVKIECDDVHKDPVRTVKNILNQSCHQSLVGSIGRIWTGCVKRYVFRWLLNVPIAEESYMASAIYKGQTSIILSFNVDI